MWHPGFPHVEIRPAILKGYHRAFCVYSRHYRGTPEKPGLVLGLDRGGECQGLAFRVAPEHEGAVKSYLNERELIGYAYTATTLPVRVPEGTVDAYTFVANPEHSQYADDLDLERSAQIIMQAEGVAGLNRDYLINTVRRLEREGILDADLHALLKRVEHLTGVIEAGSGI